MAKQPTIPALLVSFAVASVVMACGNTSTTKTEHIEGVEWNVAISKVVAFNDTILGISTDKSYTLADTARVNADLNEILPNENLKIGWSLPTSDGAIWLVAYENEPLLSEKVNVTEANSMPSYGGNIQVGFKFTDADKWAIITKDNIGKRLAVIVNGQLMNAPQVNCEITSGNCSVSIPNEMAKQYLPNIELEKLKQ